MTHLNEKLLGHLPLVSLLPEHLKVLVLSSFTPERFCFGDVILSEGSTNGAYYVLVSGRARVLTTDTEGTELPLNVLTAGDSFGEISILEGKSATATVRASDAVEALRLDAQVLTSLLEIHPELRPALALQARYRALENFFTRFTAFSELKPHALRKLLAELKPLKIESGEHVIREGHTAGSMFIVQDGKLRAYRASEGKCENLAFLRKGDFFGERSLFKGVERAASVVADTTSELLTLSPESFKELLEDDTEFKARIEQKIRDDEAVRATRRPLDFEETAITGLEDASETPGEENIVFKEQGALTKRFTHILKRLRSGKGFPLVLQTDQTDCGLACLAMICRYYGKSVSLSSLRSLVGGISGGAHLSALLTLASKLGFATESRKVSYHNLSDLPLPALVHCGGSHWAVLYSRSETEVELADPNAGLKTISHDEFTKLWSGHTGVLTHTPKFSELEVSWPHAWLHEHLKRLWAFGIFLGALLLGEALLLVVLPVVLMGGIDSLHSARQPLQTSTILNLCLSSFALLVIHLARTNVARHIGAYFRENCFRALVKHVLKRRVSYVRERLGSDLVERLENVAFLEKIFVENVVPLLFALLLLPISVVVSFYLSPLLTLVSAMSFPVYFLLFNYSHYLLYPRLNGLKGALRRFPKTHGDIFSTFFDTKALGVESTVSQEVSRSYSRISTALSTTNGIELLMKSARLAVVFFFTLLVLVLGSICTSWGRFSFGTLVSVVVLTTATHLSTYPFFRILEVLHRTLRAADQLDDAFAITRRCSENSAIPVKTISGRVRLSDVSVTEDTEDDNWALKSVSCEIEPGMVVGIVGRSGSGKTVLAKTIAGLVDVRSGKLFYDDIDAELLNRSELSQQIGFLGEENKLFEGTIRENIIFGDDSPCEVTLRRVATLTRLDEMLVQLSEGFDTYCGACGGTLSRGQVSKVLLARVLYQKPSLLIFDDRLLGFDVETTHTILNGFEELRDGRTTVLVTEDPLMLRRTDVIFVLEQGRLVEQGSHTELMDRKGLYFYLTNKKKEIMNGQEN